MTDMDELELYYMEQNDVLEQDEALMDLFGLVEALCAIMEIPFENYFAFEDYLIANQDKSLSEMMTLEAFLIKGWDEAFSSKTMMDDSLLFVPVYTATMEKFKKDRTVIGWELKDAVLAKLRARA